MLTSCLPPIAAVAIDDLRPHEEYDRKILYEVALSLQTERMVRDPIIVDASSLVILDGTHRYWALRRMGCVSVPVAMYDYASNSVGIARWNRCIASSAIFLPNRAIRVEYSNAGEALAAVTDRRASLALIGLSGSQLVIEEAFEIHSAYSLLGELEAQLRAKGCGISYATEEDSFLRLKSGEASWIMVPPVIKKEEALEAALSGRLFPIKSTRHIIPHRPINLRIPIEWLMDPPEILDSKLHDLLSRLSFRRVGAGAIVDGRRYEEEVYIGEPSNP
ncbi:MAG: ParB N-terminal domain-containing protein [Candidatus Methanosuratincola petrocarbonis]